MSDDKEIKEIANRDHGANRNSEIAAVFVVTRMVGAQRLKSAVDPVKNVKPERDVADDVNAGDQRHLETFYDIPVHVTRVRRKNCEVEQVVDDVQEQDWP